MLEERALFLFQAVPRIFFAKHSCMHLAVSLIVCIKADPVLRIPWKYKKWGMERVYCFFLYLMKTSAISETIMSSGRIMADGNSGMTHVPVI